MVNRRTNINLQSQIDAIMNAQTQALASAQSAQAVAQGIATAKPSTRPSFVLDFANSRFLDKKIPFNRNSIGTYFDRNGIMRTAGINKPRFTHDPVTKESLGLLLEDSRTNLLLQSSNFSNSIWGKTRTTIEASITQKGVYNALAAKIICSGANDPHLNQPVTVTGASQTFTFSVWLWVDEPATTKAVLRLYGATGVEELSEKTVIVTNVPTRFDITKSFSSAFASTQVVCRIDPFDGETDVPVSGRYMYVDCCQLENGFVPTSYIPTSSTVASRASDLIAITGVLFSELFPSTLEGTLLLNARKGRQTNGYHNYWKMNGLSTSGGINEIRMVNTPLSDSLLFAIYNDGIVENSSAQNCTSDVTFMSAISWKKNDVKSYVNGVGSSDDYIANIPNFNSFYVTGENNQPISQIAFWPRRVSNSALSALTTVGLSGKNPNQLPSVSDLLAGAFLSPYAILRETGKQEFPIYGDGTAKTLNIRRDYDFTFAIVDSSGSTVTSQPSASCLANTDNSLVVTIPTGKTLLYSITPVFEY